MMLLFICSLQILKQQGIKSGMAYTWHDSSTLHKVVDVVTRPLLRMPGSMPHFHLPPFHLPPFHLPRLNLPLNLEWW